MSQDTPHTKRIGQHEYQVYMLPPLDAMDLLVDLSKVAGPTLGKLVDAVKGAFGEGGIESVMDIDTSDLSGDMISGAIAELVDRLDKRMLRELIGTLSNKTLMDGKRLNAVFDAHFAGHLGEMMRWIVFALEVQYRDFWSALADTMPVVTDRVVELRPSPSPNTSIG